MLRRIFFNWKATTPRARVLSLGVGKAQDRDRLPWCLVSDVDGVLTPGKFFYSAEGKLLKEFGSHDSDALGLVMSRGLEIHFVTADHRGFAITSRRLADMGLEAILMPPAERVAFIAELQRTRRVAYIGDSFTDVPALRQADLAVVPFGSFGVENVKGAIKLRRRGGDGAVAEAVQALFGLNQIKEKL